MGCRVKLLASDEALVLLDNAMLLSSIKKDLCVCLFIYHSSYYCTFITNDVCENGAR